MNMDECYKKINELELAQRDNEELIDQLYDDAAQQAIDLINKNDKIIDLEKKNAEDTKTKDTQIKSLKRRFDYVSSLLEVQKNKKK